MRQLALDHVGDNLHATVPMGAKALPRCDVVFVHHEQVAKSDIAWVVILVEGECVMAVEPRGVRCAALVCVSYRYHVLTPFL